MFPSCDNGGLDHVCNDGKCYSQSGCPTGHTIISNNSCTCVNACTGTSTSNLQVNFVKTLLKIPQNLRKNLLISEINSASTCTVPGSLKTAY